MTKKIVSLFYGCSAVLILMGGMITLAEACDNHKISPAHAQGVSDRNIQHDPKSQAAVFEVKGLMCSSCAKKVKAALKSVKGIQNVAVHTRENLVKVVYSPSQVTHDLIVKTVEGLGYSATVSESKFD